MVSCGVFFQTQISWQRDVGVWRQRSIDILVFFIKALNKMVFGVSGLSVKHNVQVAHFIPCGHSNVCDMIISGCVECAPRRHQILGVYYGFGFHWIKSLRPLRVPFGQLVEFEVTKLDVVAGNYASPLVRVNTEGKWNDGSTRLQDAVHVSVCF